MTVDNVIAYLSFWQESNHPKRVRPLERWRSSPFLRTGRRAAYPSAASHWWRRSIRRPSCPATRTSSSPTRRFPERRRTEVETELSTYRRCVSVSSRRTVSSCCWSWWPRTWRWRSWGTRRRTRRSTTNSCRSTFTPEINSSFSTNSLVLQYSRKQYRLFINELRN